MSPTTVRQQDATGPKRGGSASPLSSPALEWLWQYHRDVRRPHLVDCGVVRTATMDILLRRCGKLYVADLLSPLQSDDPKYWDRSGKVPVFLIEDFLTRVPPIPSGSIAAAFCWHLFDLIPRDGLPKIVDLLFSLLQPGGLIFCLLREPYLPTGADTDFRFENLTTLGTVGQANRHFPYPVLTTRELEKLVPAGSVKTFLTRSGRREVLVMK